MANSGGQKRKPDAALRQFLELLFRWNRAVRLTAFRDQREALEMGIAPSLAALDVLPAAGRALDVGSGGGFPAVPLAMKIPGLSWTLLEPSARKAAFLREASRALDLDFEVREETLEAFIASAPGTFDVMTARGVRFRKGDFRRMAVTLVPEGVLLIWTGGRAAKDYAPWMREAGLATEERILGSGLPLLLAGRRAPG